MASTNTKLVVVVSGDEAQVQWVRDALPSDAFDILHASDGAACITLYEAHQPDFMILRLDTTPINAIEVTQYIRAKHAGQPYIMIVMAERDIDMIQQALDAGADDFVVDPAPSMLLRRRVLNLAIPSRLPLHVYSRLYDRIPSGVFICSVEGQLVMVNRPFCQMLGYDEHDLLQMNLLQLTAATDRQHISAALRGTLKPAQPLNVQFNTHDGVLIPVAIQMDTVEQNYVVGLASDLRSTRAAQLELKRTEQNYRNVFDAANDAILIVDAQSDQILDANKNAVHWLGYTLDTLKKMSYRALAQPDEAAAMDAALEALRQNGRHIYETTLKRRDGRALPVEVSARVIEHDTRTAILNVVRDISNRRLVEQQEREQTLLAIALTETAALVNSSLELDTVLERILSAVVRVIPGDSVNVMLIDENGQASIKLEQNVVPETAEKGTELSVHSAPTLRWMHEHQRGLIIEDVANDPRWTDTGKKRWMRSYVGAPLIVDGQTIGFINVDGARVSQFNEMHLHYLQVFAAQASLAIRNARLYTQMQTYATDLEKRVQERTAQLSAINQSLQEQVQERKRAEQALAEERNRLRALIDALPDQVYIKDLEGRFTLINAACQRHMPPPFRDISVIGLTDFDIYPRAQAEEWRQEELELLESGKPLLNRESQWISAQTGRRMSLLVSKIPMYDSNGQLEGLLGINHNITELRQAEADLAHIISSANCLLWYADVKYTDGRLAWDIHITSESAARRFMPLKVRPGQTYQQAWSASVFPEDLARLKAHTQTALLNGEPGYSYEARIQREDGQTRWLSFDVRVIAAQDNYWSLVGVCTDITERKTLEEVLRQSNEILEMRVQERTAALESATEQLRASEEKYRTLTNQLPVGVYRISADYVIQYANTAMARMLGVSSAEELIGDSPNNYWLRPEVAHEIVQRTLPPPNVARQDEFRIRRRDGRMIWVRNTWHAIYDEQGRVLFFDGSLEDITTRKLAQLAEYEQRTFAEALSEAAADLNRTLDLDNLLDRILEQIGRVMPDHEGDEVVLLDDDNTRGHIIRFQQRHEDGLINTQPALESHFVLDFIPNFVHMRDTAQPIIIDDTHTSTRWKHLPQTEWIRAYLGVPILSDGQVLGFISLTSSKPRTFTEQHATRLTAFANQVGIAIKNARLYAAVQRSAEHLREQVEERTRDLSRQTTMLNTILNALAEGVAYFDMAGQAVFSNHSMVQLTQMEGTTSFTVQDMYQMIDIPNQDGDKLIKDAIQTLNSGQRWESEVRIRRRDGSIFDAHVNVIRIGDSYDSHCGTLIVLRDITREKAIEEQRRRFVSYASHELRTPIANLSTRLYLARKQPERVQEHLEVIDSVVKRMRQLTDDLLDISRMERGALVLNLQPQDLRELVAEVVLMQVTEAERKGIALKMMLPDMPVPVMIDRDRMWRVVANLTTNAIRYTERGTVTLELSVRDSHAALTVRDTGIGIAPEILPHIFKLFVRGKQDSSGSGLGLTIVRELVELHGGAISVESELGQGSAFTVLLKLARTPETNPHGVTS